MSTARSALVTLAGSVGPLMIALLTVPLLLGAIGAERYGALAIAWVLLGYFGQADFGIGRAVTQRIATMRDATREDRARTVCSALVAIGGLGLVAGLAAALAAIAYFGGPFEVERGLRAELVASAWLIGVAVPLVALFGTAHGSLVGAERFAHAAGAMFAGNAGMHLIPLGIALTGDITMPALVAGSLAGRALGLLVALAGLDRVFARGTRLSVSRGEVAALLGYGKWIMVTALVGPLMIAADRFAIGALMGAAAVAAYAIPFQVASRALLVPLAGVQVIFPRLAALDEARAQHAARHYFAATGALFAPVAIGLACLAEPLLALWIGPDLDPRSVLVARILLAGFWVNAAAHVPYSLIQARGRPRFTALLHCAELPIYAAMLAALAVWFGLAGVAVAFALRCMLDGLALMRGARLPLASLRPLAFPATLLLAALALHTVLEGWSASLAAAAILGGMAAWHARTSIPPELAGPIISRFGRGQRES